MTTPSTPTSTMKEAERLVTEFARVCRLAPTGVVPGIEGDHLEQCAKDALLAFIRSLVEAMPSAVADQKCLPNGLRYLMPPLVLTGYQLREALDFIAPDKDAEQMEQELCIAARDGVKDEDGDKTLPPGLFMWFNEYPEEGCLPLDGAAPSAVLPLKGEVPTPAHNGHPMRHWDRTCPACIASIDNGAAGEGAAAPSYLDRTGCTAGKDEECTNRQCATNCPALAASPVAVEPPMDEGPWTISPDAKHLYSDDFTHDVSLKIMGDFADEEQRRRYAVQLCEKLNFALAARPTPAAGVPPGFVMVPLEPTPEMCAAGFSVSEAEHDPAGVFRAMLAARPLPGGVPTGLIEALESFDDALRAWADAYPLTAFPEPDFKAVGLALGERGITLDSVSASSMRHVVTTLDGLFAPVRAALSAGAPSSLRGERK